MRVEFRLASGFHPRQLIEDDMRFLLTMNMPSYAGNSVHQINAEYPVKSLEEFVEALATNDFIVVEEFYKDRNDGEYYSRGHVVLNHRYIGKIKILGQYKED